jgi:hypothetical protein
MKSTRGLWIALAAVCALGTSVGCYTMLKHPRINLDDKSSHAGENYYNDEAISFADDCASCHSPGSLQVHHPAVPPPRRFVSPTWDYYYDYPWWIPYYTAGNTNGNAATPEEEQKKRPFDRRHQSRPEEPATAPSSASTPSPSTPAPATVAKPADPGAPASTPQKTENTTKREERDSGKSQSGERRTRKP